MRKKVLIGYASYGSGHKAVAHYIKSYFDKFNDYEVMILNLSEYSSGFGKLAANVFDHVNKREHIFSFFYDIVNNKLMGKGNIQLCLKSFDTSKVREVFKEFNPDIVISTHYYTSYYAGLFKKENVINSKIFTVITDFSHHSWWTVNKEDINYFIVANDMVKNELISHGIEASKICPFGIPINRDYIRNVDNKEFVLKKYSLNGGKPIYLFFAGGSDGFDSAYDYFVPLVKAKLPIDIIFVCGKNKKLKDKCEKYIADNDIKNVIVLGFSKDVFNLLNISDVVITKPGGSTVNEIISMKKPSILIPGVGGQEKYNAKYMVKKHYSLKVRGTKNLVRKVKLCINYPFIVNSMKNKLCKMNEEDACKKIYELANKEVLKKD